MDHVPLPKTSIRSALHVPYVVMADHEYDGLGVSSFPERKNFDIRNLKAAAFSQSQWDEALSFLQAWAFFGLLTDIFGVPGISIKPKDFICERDSKQYITTELLPYFLRLWASRESTANEGEKENRLFLVDKCLSNMHRYLNGISSSWADLQTESDISASGASADIPNAAQSVLLSILVLAESLSYGRYFAYGIGIARPFSWSKSWFLDEWMLEAGWCPFEIN